LKLRLKLFTLLTFSYLLIFIVLQFASNSFLLRGIEDIENNDLEQDMLMSVSSFSHRVTEVEEATTRFSTYSDTYQYMKARDRLSKDYILDIFNDAALSEAEINYVLLFDTEGEVVLTKGYNLANRVEMNVSDELVNFFEMNSILVTHQDQSSKLSGILETPDGLWIMSSQPISAGTDNVIGSLLMGRELDSREAETLKKINLLSLSIIPLLEPVNQSSYSGIISEMTEDSPIVIQSNGSDSMIGYTMFHDVYGNPAVLLKVDYPRVIYQEGIRVLNYFVLSFVLIGVSIGMLVLLATNRLVIMRLSKLSNDVSKIDPSAIDEVSVEESGDDEISSLSQDIEKMLNTIKEYQGRLKQTERMVSIGATATMVGHDLRNPLQVVFMLTDLIQKRIGRLMDKGEEPELDDLQKLTIRVKDQATYMNKIVSDLQGLTKGVSLVIEKIDLEELIYEVLETIPPSENLERRVIFEDDFPEVQVDRAKLRRVFTNLITNAVQSMESKGGELVVKGHRVEDQVYVSVMDTGDGIPQEYIGRIFDPLFTTKAKGTGLGLTVCKRAVEAHGGEIMVQSQPNVGSRFTVILPINNVQEDLNHIQENYTEYAMPQGHILPSCL
jgi:signal transduction histidine kinase